MNDLNTLLQESNLLYREMIRCLDILKKSPRATMEPQSGCGLDAFNTLQKQIEDKDRCLAPKLDNPHESNEITKILIAERQSLLECILAQNKAVTTQATSIQSMLRDELQKSSKGHTALQGYRQNDQSRKNGSLKKTL